ncbi:hypothetical protein IGI04_028730 [Brassica rapa subsp. trilocularis]|nr:hypothetical protein IGI04_028730 [Brassica rapa subsp. trilocularis]
MSGTDTHTHTRLLPLHNNYRTEQKYSPTKATRSSFLSLKENKNNQDLSLMESRMEGDVFSGFGERHQMDGKVLQSFQKSFVQVQDILDQNRLLINEINQNHESKQADHLGRNVGLIRELNNNIRTVASLYGDLSHSFARSIDASSEGESTGTNNQKRFRSG